MDDFFNEPQEDWKAILAQLSHVRETGDYSPEDVELIRHELRSEDERIRGAAALAAEGCLFEPYILDLIIEIAEYDPNPPIRKAAIQSLCLIIEEGIEQGLEDDSGADTSLDYAEEWEEYQSGGLREDYQRAKGLLFSILEIEDDPEIQGLAVNALSGLGYISEVREKIAELFQSENASARRFAVRAMGKYPHFWDNELETIIKLDTPLALLKEAISASFSSNSADVAKAIEAILNHEDPEVLRYALLTLANINQTKNLLEVLQQFSLHEDEDVQKAARESIEMSTRRNFDRYLKDYFGMDE